MTEPGAATLGADDAPLNVSVIVVSRGRPGSLRLCISGLSRLDYPNYEIVVVTDPAGLAVVRDMELADEVKTVEYDDANISIARNRGIAQAAGDIVAFIDDDAVPEPTWLAHLTKGFSWPDAAAVGGYVRGRNGISFQWRARTVDHTGLTADLDVTGDAPVLLTPAAGRGIKTEGTNMAFRRAVLAEMGGFDPAFRFFLDETDLNLRLAFLGHCTAVAPLAEVHHAYAESVFRAASRAPRDLFDVGASTALFLRKHCPVDEHDAVLARLRRERRLWLLGYLVDGRLEPRDIGHLMMRLDQGIKAGMERPFSPMPPIPHSPHWFLPFETRSNGKKTVIAGRYIRRRRHRNAAQRAAEAGDNVSLFLFSRTALHHVVRFNANGYWEQRGGMFGRSLRSDPALRLISFRRRLERERRRVAKARGM